MRVSQHILFESTYRELNRSIERLLSAQRKAASARRVLRPSDDPLAAQRILDLRASRDHVASAVRNGQYAQAWLSVTETALHGMEEVVMRAQELAMVQSSGTMDTSTREVAAQEVKQLYDQMVHLANTRFGDRYVFGGTQTQMPPVERDELYNPTFHANEQEIQIRVHGGLTLPLNVPLKRVLGDDSEGALVTLRDLIQALEADDPDAVAATLDDLDRDLDRILKVASEVGARINTYQRQQQSLEDMEVDLMETISEYQDADVARVFSDLVNQQTVYEAALRSTAMITRVNLMDFIQ